MNRPEKTSFGIAVPILYLGIGRLRSASDLRPLTWLGVFFSRWRFGLRHAWNRQADESRAAGAQLLAVLIDGKVE